MPPATLRGQILADRTKLAAIELVDAEQPDLETIANDHAIRGLGRSGSLIMARVERRLSTLNQLIRERLRLEKDEKEYPLTAEDEETWNNELLESIAELTVDQEKRLLLQLDDDCQRILGAASKPIIDEVSQRIAKVRYLAIREVGMMKDERQHRKKATPPPAPPAITLNISHSQIAGLNVGGTVGYIETTVNVLQTSGADKLAAAVKALTEAIPGSSLSNEEKRDYLDLVSAMADELARPQEKQRLGVLKSVGQNLNSILAHASEVYALYEGLKVIVRTTTGYELP